MKTKNKRKYVRRTQPVNTKPKRKYTKRSRVMSMNQLLKEQPASIQKQVKKMKREIEMGMDFQNTINEFVKRHHVTNQEIVAMFEYAKYACLHDTHSSGVSNEGR